MTAGVGASSVSILYFVFFALFAAKLFSFRSQHNSLHYSCAEKATAQRRTASNAVFGVWAQRSHLSQAFAHELSFQALQGTGP
jgi:hypothetical protein